MEENNSNKDISKVTAQQSAIVTNKVKGKFKLNEEKSKNIASDQLEKSQTAELAGTFIPSEAGKQKLVAVFKYAEGKSVEAFTETEVIQVKLKLRLLKPEFLSEKLPFNFKQEVEFFIENPTEFDATKILLKVSGLLDGLFIVREKPDGKGDYEKVEDENLTLADFSENSAITLDSKHRFRLKGKIKTDKIGTETLSILVKYDELKTLSESDPTKDGEKFEKTITIEGVSVVGNVKTKLPDKVKLGESYEVIFEFTNQSANFPATGVNISIEEKPEGDHAYAVKKSF